MYLQVCKHSCSNSTFTWPSSRCQRSPPYHGDHRTNDGLVFAHHCPREEEYTADADNVKEQHLNVGSIDDDRCPAKDANVDDKRYQQDIDDQHKAEKGPPEGVVVGDLIQKTIKGPYY